MKSKNPKIQEKFKKGIAVFAAGMMLLTPLTYATTSLDDSYLDSSWLEQLLYGTIGSTANEIEEWFNSGHATLYIQNETQLRALAEYVNNGNDCDGKVIKLINDIEVDSSNEWVPIGNISAHFKGTFDGQSYTISGINFNRGDKLLSEITNVGLFGYVYNATIKNVIIANSKFDIPYDISSDILNVSSDLTDFDGSSFTYSYKNLGGIVGYNNNGTIENCATDKNAYINGLCNVGGIVGYNYRGEIKNCSNSGSINGFGGVGGIVGRNSGVTIKADTVLDSSNLDFTGDDIAKVISCVNNGNIYSLIGGNGGISGISLRNSIIQKSENNGTVRASTVEVSINIGGKIESYPTQNIGGIVGYITGVYENENKGYAAIDACINNGEVIGYRDIGGIAGQLGGMGGGNVIFTNNINYSTAIEGTDEGTNNDTGFLAGEVGNGGKDSSYNTADDPHTYMANNFYLLTDTELENITGESDEITFADGSESITAMGLVPARNVLKSYIADNEYNNEAVAISDKQVKLGYGALKTNPNNTDYKCFTEGSSREENNSADIIYTDGTNYYVVYNTEKENEMLVKKLVDTNIDIYNIISTDSTNSTNDKKFEISELGIKTTDENAFKVDGNTWSINSTSNSNTEYTIDASTGTTVKYSIYKNSSEVNGNAYFKEGDIIKVTTTFNKYLAQTYGPPEKITTAPTLKLNNSIEMTAGTVNVNTSNYTTTINYTYTVTSEKNLEITTLNLSKSGTIYAISGSDYSTNHPSFSGINSSVNVDGLIIDTTAPLIDTKVYVENALETGRYTSGKEIIFEVTTNETIEDTYDLPEIQVSFSESGIGKYNYSTETNTVGYAKCKYAKINLDGTTTWIYTYQVQEGDEGEVELTYTAGAIKDLAGNQTKIADLYSASSDETGSSITGTEWNNDLNVTFEFYKNSVSDANKITSQTYLTDTDDLIVVATYDKVLYVHYGLSDGKNTNVRLTNSTKDRAPSLYLNGNSALKQSGIDKVTTTNYVESTATSGTTTVQYRFTDVAKNYGLENLTQVTKVVLKNENNTENITVNGTSAATNGMIPYAEKWYITYNSEQKDDYNTTLTSGKVKTVNDLDDIIIDPVGVTTRIDKTDIYADTTAPTVTITADKTNPTNADLITYTFEFSEKVEGFTADDITVNNGVKATETEGTGDEAKEVVKFTEVTEGLKYTLEVIPSITAGNEGILQVIVEEGVCQDLVAKNNIRQESTITIDKVAPTITITADKDYVKADEIITYTFTWSEGVNEFTADDITVNNGTKETFAGEGNHYTLEVIPNGGNDVEVSVEKDVSVDNAGNNNIASEKHVIAVIPTVTISTDTSNPTNASEITYTFTWSEEVNGFDISDIILPNGLSGTLTEVNDTTYTMIVNYNSLIPEGNEGEVTVAVKEKAVQDLNGNENAYTANTLKIDRKAPILLSLEAYAISDPEITLDPEVDVVKEYYKAGDQIGILATFSENIAEQDTKLALQFSESGNAGNIADKDIEIIGNKIAYIYTIQEGDKGTLSIKGFTGEVEDQAENSTLVTRKTLDGNTIIADTDAPSLNELKVVSPSEGTYKAGTTIKIEAIYDENVYALKDNEIKNITSELAPTLKFKFGNGTEREATFNGYVGEDKTRLEYTVSIVDGDNGDNGELSITSYTNKSNVKVCDIAGNEAGLNENQTGNEIIADTIRPVVQSVTAVVENPTISGTDIYHKEGKEIYVIATFDEPIAQENMKLKAKVGEVEIPELLDGEIVEANDTMVKFTYTVKAGDMGEFKILDICGETDNTRTEEDADKTYGWVQDAYGNQNNIYNLTDEGVTETGTAVADTESPYITSIKALANDKEIATYTKEKDKDAVVTVGRTNANIVEYIVKYNEEVPYSHFDNISITNGIIKDIEYTNAEFNEYKITVQTTVEGVQSLIINEGTIEDKAGNIDEFVRFNAVTVDFTKPIIRAKVNGGNYVIATDTNKSVLKETIVVNEELSKFEYAWSTSEDINSITEWIEEDVTGIISNSDINLETKMSSEGTYYLYLKVTDLAGNTLSARTNGFVVLNSRISFSGIPTSVTNQDVTVNVTYGEGLTENRKAGISGKTQSADASKIIITENGTVYAEATDKAGNKVYKTFNIQNIDKTAPKASIEYSDNEDGSVTATISFNEEATVTNNSGETTYIFTENGEFTFEFKDKAGNTGTAVAKVTTIVPKDEIAPIITFNYTLSNITVGDPIGATILTNEDAIISYSWDNSSWISSEEYITSVNATYSPTEAGTYTLYAKATDRAKNESRVQTLKFTVVNNVEDIKEPKIIFEDLPIIQVDGIKYVKVAADMTIEDVTNKMDKEALCEKTPEYKELTKDGKLKTGSEITLNGDTKYIVVVNGDVNCDGKVTLADVVSANKIRTDENIKAKTHTIIASDFNLDGSITLADIVSINKNKTSI